LSTNKQSKRRRRLLPFLAGFVAGDFIHAYIMDWQNSGDFFDPEGLMILLVAGPFTSPAMCLSIMFASGLATLSLPMLTPRGRGRTGAGRHPLPD
jgi:hypothetical protein